MGPQQPKLPRLETSDDGPVGLERVVGGNDQGHSEGRRKEALFILKSSISATELDKTGMCRTAHELWKKLQENYEGTKSTMIGAVAAAWAVFSGQPNGDLISYCGRFETLLAELRAVSDDVPEDQKFLFFIRSLPKARQEFCHT